MATSGGYRALFAQPGVPRLSGAMLLARLGGAMWQVALILFTLHRFHSPALAGLVAAAGLLPGVLAGPIAGALLDRHGRVGLILVDYGVGAATALAIFGTAAAGWLSAPLLVALAALSAITLPLGATGTRSLLPLIVPRTLWDRGNAVDSMAYRLTAITGPALAGLLVALIGDGPTLAVIAITWLAAGVVLFGTPEPAAATDSRRPLMADAWAGLRYLLGNRTLRSLAVLMPMANFGGGTMSIAIPLLVSGRFHLGPAEVGVLFSAQSVAALAANAIMGGLRTTGHEARYMAAGLIVMTAGLAAVAVAPTYAIAIAAQLLGGAGMGLIDVPMFGLRQRAADPAWFGRALSISMMLNSVGTPIGAAVTGPLASRSLTLAILVAAGFTAAGAIFTWLLLGRRPASQPPAPAVLHRV